MEEITLTINGKKISARPGSSILDAATENGIKIPTLCHHRHLTPVGACRICLVEDEKSGRIMASCVTPVSQDMAIRTDSPTVRRHRTNIVRLMMANHPESCIVCSRGNKCELRQVAADLGVGITGLYPMPYYRGLEQANPFIIRDLSKCILCGRCIRADHELVVVGAIDYNLRGFRSRPATAHDMPLEKSECTFCGTCVSLCPTGALSIGNPRYVGSPEKESATVCGFCGVGCTLVMGSVDGQVVETNPSHEDETVNQSTLCVRGHFAHDFLNVKERLTRPLIRKGGELSPSTWEEALNLISERLLSIKKTHGPQSLGLYGSSKCTNEENYLFQRIARSLLETNNVDNGGNVNGLSTMNAVAQRLGGSIPPARLSALEDAEVILVIGADPTQSLPVVGYFLKRASRNNGVPMIVADPRKNGLVPFASLWLPLSPQTDSDLIHALAAILYKREAFDARYIDRFTQGFDLYQKGLAAFDLGRASRSTGLESGLMEEAADQLQGKKIAFVVGQGVLLQRNGVQTMHALLNLALMTGSLGDQKRGIYILASENNGIGALDMGCAPGFLPGRGLVTDEARREYWERIWGVRLSPDPGLSMVRMVEEAEKGNLKALYVMGENPLRGFPEIERVRRAFQNLEFLVVQDILSNETGALADVVLPGAAFSEKAGSFTNLEGRIQSFESVVLPQGEAKPDLEILAQLAYRMGQADQDFSLLKIRREIRRVIPAYSELRDDPGQSWVTEMGDLGQADEEGHPVEFTPIAFAADRLRDDTYPLEGILTSTRLHLGSGTRTGLSARITGFSQGGDVELSFEDAARLDLVNGDQVRVSSKYGAVARRVRVKKDLPFGLVYIPVAFYGNEARQLVALTQPGKEESPGWMQVSVKVEKIENNEQ
ncbi:MAG: molybdopterin-dependent oxidoreductase [Deltaproteobacteria bacterium]|nr:molybdopterin-dependent oxidoreductase [Deltaproteobacteria bacterium]